VVQYEQDVPPSVQNHMDRETLRHERHFYSAYAEELREKFRDGYLAELLPYAHFVVWKHQLMDGKPHKPPYSPIHHKLADPTDPDSWGTLDLALKALSTGSYNGIGFVFAQDDPYAAVDLDHCVNANRFIHTWAKGIIDTLHTHTHYSPREGVHLLFAIDKGRFPGQNRKVGDVEFFIKDHYLTITPNHVPGTPTTIEQRDIEAASLFFTLVPEELWPQPRNTRGNTTTVWTPQHEQPEPKGAAAEKPDAQIIQEALAEERSNFARYWHGGPALWTGPAALRRSRSEAMFTLLVMLAERVGDMPEEAQEEQVKRLYKESGMYTPQRDDANAGHDRRTGQRVTYLEMSARNAIRKRKRKQQKG
jgi:putative DNA primase/helicase